jgi:hypothetical protein
METDSKTGGKSSQGLSRPKNTLSAKVPLDTKEKNKPLCARYSDATVTRDTPRKNIDRAS